MICLVSTSFRNNFNRGCVWSRGCTVWFLILLRYMLRTEDLYLHFSIRIVNWWQKVLSRVLGFAYKHRKLFFRRGGGNEVVIQNWSVWLPRYNCAYTRRLKPNFTAMESDLGFELPPTVELTSKYYHYLVTCRFISYCCYLRTYYSLLL
jgi:hypothetical protein